MKLSEVEVSLFSGINDKHPKKHLNLEKALRAIKSGLWQDDVEQCHNLYDEVEAKFKALKIAEKRYEKTDPEYSEAEAQLDRAKERYDAKKKSLPVLTFGVECSSREKTFDKKHEVVGPTIDQKVIQFNRIITIDYDYKDDRDADWKKVRKLLEEDPHVLAVFSSPSGRGLKVLVRFKMVNYADKLPADDWDYDQYLRKEYRVCFSKVNQYLEKKTGLKADSSGSDLFRVCYISFDPGLHYDLKSIPLTVDVAKQNRHSTLPAMGASPVHGRSKHSHQKESSNGLSGSEFSLMSHYLLKQVHVVLPQWLPDGKFTGDEYEARNPMRDDKTAGSFNIDSKEGIWKDFACENVGGSDLVSLYAYLFCKNHQREALQALKCEYPDWKEVTVDPAIDSTPNSDWVLIQPIPCDIPFPKGFYKLKYWIYYNSNGERIGYVVRNDVNGKKTFFPLTCWENRQTGQEEWRRQALPIPRPLYNLDYITETNEVIVVTEGEKAAEAAAELLKKVTTTSMNGAHAAKHTDWSPLIGKEIWIWPDHDEAGEKYLKDVVALLGEQTSIRVMRFIGDHPLGWDAADALEEGWKPVLGTTYTLEEVVRPNSYKTYCLSHAELMQISLPPITFVVEGLFTTSSISLVYGPRGIGKSWFVLELAVSICTATPFFVWKVPQPRTVVVIDGEMGLSLLQERYQYRSKQGLDNLRFVSSDRFPLEKALNITDTEVQTWLESCFREVSAEVLIFDNRSTLCAGLDENSNQDQERYLMWLLKLRKQKFLVILIDHTGKDASRGLRGASKKEDIVNTSVELVPREKDAQATFRIVLRKCRHERPACSELSVRLKDESEITENSPSFWVSEKNERWGSTIKQGANAVLLLLADGQKYTQVKLAKKLEINQGTVSRYLHLLVEQGYLTKNHSLAQEGMKHVKEIS